jgi:hypothetical protein
LAVGYDDRGHSRPTQQADGDRPALVKNARNYVQEVQEDPVSVQPGQLTVGVETVNPNIGKPIVESTYPQEVSTEDDGKDSVSSKDIFATGLQDLVNGSKDRNHCESSEPITVSDSVDGNDLGGITRAVEARD